MPEWTSHSRWLPSSTRSKAAWLAFAVVCGGCGRQPARTAKGVSINGYVNVQTLMEAHPGWREVEELNSALATPGPARPGVVRADATAPKAYPAPLNVGKGPQRNTTV